MRVLAVRVTNHAMTKLYSDEMIRKAFAAVRQTITPPTVSDRDAAGEGVLVVQTTAPGIFEDAPEEQAVRVKGSAKTK